LNYYSYIGDTVGVAVANTGEDALSATGRLIYDNDSQFGVRCGDKLITSYPEGALYAFSALATFESEYDKQEFLDKTPEFAADEPFDIVTATAIMNKTIYHYDLKGSLSMIAH